MNVNQLQLSRGIDNDIDIYSASSCSARIRTAEHEERPEQILYIAVFMFSHYHFRHVNILFSWLEMRNLFVCRELLEKFYRCILILDISNYYGARAIFLMFSAEGYIYYFWSSGDCVV